MTRYRTAFYEPLVADWSNFGNWTQSGSKSATERATGRRVRLPVAAPWVLVVAVVAPLVDISVGTAVGFPTPLLSLIGVGVAVGVRRRALGARRAAVARSSA